MDDNMKLKGATEEEMLYMFNESMKLKIQTGFMGYLRAAFCGGEQGREASPFFPVFRRRMILAGG